MTVTYPTEANEQPFPGLAIQKFLTWLFLASEVMFFTGLIVAYITIRFNSSSWPVVSEVLNVPLVAANTFILIVSSVTMVLALDAAERGQPRFRYFLVATMVLGIIFLSIQAIEWAELMGHGVLPSTNLFGATFYTLTGFHGAHVTGGVLWILGVTIAAFRRPKSYMEDPIGIEVLGLYWHFVDLVWIILFTIV
ncbi:MAG TPA: heme-copper oxidase subunit III, partial [Anaerolineae bacterium]|nr:heme-copper oxidase subunit III [Anaerolineae bacterium]